MFGLLNIHKPAGLSSHSVVGQVRRRCPRKTRVGHTGTLDPFATGVLVVGVGPATKLADYVQRQAKEYEAEITLDVTSTTDDTEGELSRAESPGPPPDETTIREAPRQFVVDGGVNPVGQIRPKRQGREAVGTVGLGVKGLVQVPAAVVLPEIEAEGPLLGAAPQPFTAAEAGPVYIAAAHANATIPLKRCRSVVG